MMFYLTYFDYKLKHKSIILKLVEKRNCVIKGGNHYKLPHTAKEVRAHVLD